MKVLKKIVPYKIRRLLPIAGIAAMGMALPSCDKDDEPVPIHDTVYTWGHFNFHNGTPTFPAKKIRASADSASVRYVILKSDGISWGSAFDEREIRQLIVEPQIEFGGKHNRHKFKGAGTIKHVILRYPEDYKWLTDFGYIIIPSTTSVPYEEQKQR